MIAHSVFFTLHDRSDAARDKLVNECRLHLTGHAGLVSFACGIMDPTFDREVNDRDFDVSLIMIFGSRAEHDLYQGAPRHRKFVEANEATWAKVRVFDSDVEVKSSTA